MRKGKFPKLTSVSQNAQYLDSMDWLTHAGSVALKSLVDLELALHELGGAFGRTRVHDVRISFRRWFVVWKILRLDGWQTKKFSRGPQKELRKACQALGWARDWDVTLKLASSLSMQPDLLQAFKKERKKARKKAIAVLGKCDLATAIRKACLFVEKRRAKLAEQIESGREGSGKKSGPTARARLEEFLRERESLTKVLSDEAISIDDLHQVRLSIKAWRYLLAEFYGCSSPALVESQQILGYLNDLERLRSILLLPEFEMKGNRDALETVLAAREDCLGRWSQARENLPYGFRP